MSFNIQKLHFSIIFRTAKIHFSIKTAKQITKKMRKKNCFAVKFQTIYRQNQVTPRFNMLITLKFLRTLINIVSQGGSRKSCTFVNANAG